MNIHRHRFNLSKTTSLINLKVLNNNINIRNICYMEVDGGTGTDYSTTSIYGLVGFNWMIR